MYRIVSFDGGGVRGVVPLEALVRTDREYPGWRERIDLIAGTSTGAFIALGLASGLEPEALLEAYRRMAGRVFRDTVWDDLRDLGCAIGAEYEIEHLRAVLTETFGDRRLGELTHSVLIPAFDTRRGCPKFFHNLDGSDSDADERVWQVALRSSAAPVYFPAAERYVDGGIVVNNPALAAVAQTQDARNRQAAPGLDTIRVCSFGTGRAPQPYRHDPGDWGWAQWARPLLRFMVGGSESVVDYQCRQLLGRHYHRFEPAFDVLPPIDDPAAMDDLIRRTRTMDLQPLMRWIARQWMDTAVGDGVSRRSSGEPA